MSDDRSVGETLADFGGNTDMLTDYYCGQIDSDGEPTEYYDGPEDGPEYDQGDDGGDGDDDASYEDDGDYDNGDDGGDDGGDDQ